MIMAKQRYRQQTTPIGAPQQPQTKGSVVSISNRRRRRRRFVLLLCTAVLVLIFSDIAVADSATSDVVMDAENGGVCVDADPKNCPFWAVKGECDANRGYMHVHCKKSCDRCHIVRVKDRNEINRLVAEKKKELEKKRELKQKSKEALEALASGLDEL